MPAKRLRAKTVSSLFAGKKPKALSFKGRAVLKKERHKYKSSRASTKAKPKKSFVLETPRKNVKRKLSNAYIESKTLAEDRTIENEWVWRLHRSHKYERDRRALRSIIKRHGLDILDKPIGNESVWKSVFSRFERDHAMVDKAKQFESQGYHSSIAFFRALGLSKQQAIEAEIDSLLHAPRASMVFKNGIVYVAKEREKPLTRKTARIKAIKFIEENWDNTNAQKEEAEKERAIKEKHGKKEIGLISALETLIEEKIKEKIKDEIINAIFGTGRRPQINPKFGRLWQRFFLTAKMRRLRFSNNVEMYKALRLSLKNAHAIETDRVMYLGYPKKIAERIAVEVLKGY
ncbi:MAG: hypothetical protein Q7S21_00405 [archaeon]|nr:hypothetical protein [archaeon]